MEELAIPHGCSSESIECFCMSLAACATPLAKHAALLLLLLLPLPPQRLPSLCRAAAP